MAGIDTVCWATSDRTLYRVPGTGLTPLLHCSDHDIIDLFVTISWRNSIIVSMPFYDIVVLKRWQWYRRSRSYDSSPSEHSSALVHFTQSVKKRLQRLQGQSYAACWCPEEAIFDLWKERTLLLRCFCLMRCSSENYSFVHVYSHEHQCSTFWDEYRTFHSVCVSSYTNLHWWRLPASDKKTIDEGGLSEMTDVQDLASEEHSPMAAGDCWCPGEAVFDWLKERTLLLSVFV